MPKFSISLPFSGEFIVDIDASDEKEAMAAALEADVTMGVTGPTIKLTSLAVSRGEMRVVGKSPQNARRKEPWISSTA